MGLDLDTLRSELRGHCGYEDAIDLPDIDADRMLNRSLWEVVFDLPLKSKEKTQVFETVVGQSDYETPIDFESLRTLAVINPTTGLREKLERSTAAWFAQNQSINDSDRAIPAYYLREHDCIKLHPVPNDIYIVEIKSLIDIYDLVHETDQPEMHRVYHEIILYGAVYRQFLKNNDFITSSHFKAYQSTAMDKLLRRNVESKEETDSSRAGVEAIIPDYP